jgi:lipoprotein-anchoring transpeptidase ErfK/SrfK
MGQRANGAFRAHGWLLVMVFSTAGFAQPDRAPEPTSLAPSQRQVIVSLPDRKLVVMERGAVLGIFPVAVGARTSPSPTGTFTITSRLTPPTYYHAGIVIPPGKDNPLGQRWLGLNKQGYGIHGTNRPGSVGKAASHGCIRLRNRDIVQLFALVRVGDSVEIHGERDERIAEIFGDGGNTPTVVAQAQPAVTGAVGDGQ